jgi:hypothetical protein
MMIIVKRCCTSRRGRPPPLFLSTPRNDDDNDLPFLSLSSASRRQTPSRCLLATSFSLPACITLATTMGQPPTAEATSTVSSIAKTYYCHCLLPALLMTKTRTMGRQHRHHHHLLPPLFSLVSYPLMTTSFLHLHAAHYSEDDNNDDLPPSMPHITTTTLPPLSLCRASRRQLPSASQRGCVG